MELLSAAVRILKSGREPSLNDITRDECEINLHLPALLPDTYIGDINLRLSLYKRLAAAENSDQIEDLKIELIDRFGSLPEAAENLFKITLLRQQADHIGIARIIGDGEGGLIELRPEHIIDSDYLVQLMLNCKHNEYRLAGASTLRYRIPETEERPRLAVISQLLRAFAAHVRHDGAKYDTALPEADSAFVVPWSAKPA